MTKNVVTETVRDFAACCTTHGISYIFQREQAFIHRIIWVIIVLSGVSFVLTEYLLVLIRNNLGISFLILIPILSRFWGHCDSKKVPCSTLSTEADFVSINVVLKLGAVPSLRHYFYGGVPHDNVPQLKAPMTQF